MTINLDGNELSFYELFLVAVANKTLQINIGEKFRAEYGVNGK